MANLSVVTLTLDNDTGEMRINAVSTDARTAFLMSQLFAKITFEGVIASANHILEERNESNRCTVKSEVNVKSGDRD